MTKVRDRIAKAIKPSARVTRAVLALTMLGAFATSCKESNDPGVLSTLVVAPNPATVAAGQTVQFTASGTDFTGASVVPNAGAVVWSVANGGGTINPTTGLFTAVTTPGTYTNTIVATCRGISASATVIVTPGPLATITVTPSPTLAIGAQQQFTAVGKDAFGNTVAFTPVWTATNPPGTINSSTGLFTAGNTLGVFANSVTATSGTISGKATVTVIAGPVATITVTPNPATMQIGAQQQFTAVGTDAGGNVVPITPVWTTTNPPGTINSSTGLFTAGNTTGTFANAVTATAGGKSGSATVVVTAGPVATITVTPNPATMATGAQQQFTAVGTDAGGNVVPITPVWTATNPPGTINSSTGLFTAGNTTGTFANAVTATAGGKSGSATVIVTAGPVATIVVTPNPATLAPGDQQQFTAVGKDASGNVVPITPVWTTTNPPGTINSSTGVFTAGTTTGTFADAVTATSGGKSGTATVIISAPIPPPIPFRMIARVAWTCTNGSIVGDIGTNQTATEVPPGAITQTLCPITGGTPQLGTTAAKAAYQDFLKAYTADSSVACGTTLTGTLAGQTLAPGVYCFDAGATLTGTLTLSGPATGVWLFKIGNLGPGALTGTNFSVVMAGGASDCNVTWWVKDASTMTTSNLKGAILAGAGVSFSGGTFEGSAYSKQDVTVTGTPVTACKP
jgi:hypothetical protein